MGSLESTTGDYILGTGDEEIERLGLQHRIWRPTMLECWREAGINLGQRIIDVGAGPGYAAIDLAEIVGSDGTIVAVERSPKFVQALERTARARRLTQLRVHESDLMEAELPGGEYDFSWCRWVASFVSDAGLLVRKIAAALRPGGNAIFHEYAHYTTWRFAPRQPLLEDFTRKVAASWRESVGEPDIAYSLLPLLASYGFSLRWVKPRLFCARPADYFWQWPASFIDVGTARLTEIGVMSADEARAVREEFATVSRNAEAFLLTPLVFEIVARKT